RDEAGGLGAGGVEVLVRGVERDREDRALLPLEGDLRALVVPHAGRAAAVEDVDHLLEELALRRELLAGRDLADVRVVRRARGVVVEEDALAAAARPRLQLDGVEVDLVDRALDLEPFRPHPLRVRRLLLGGELLRHLVGDDRVFLCHDVVLAVPAYASTLILPVRNCCTSSGVTFTPGRYSGASSICSRSFNPQAL